MYFVAMFREGGMSESNTNRIAISEYDKLSFSRLLEFIYTNGIKDMDRCSADEVISLLTMANQYVLDDLRLLCQHTAKPLLSLDNIGNFFLLSQRNNAEGLKKACEIFIGKNKKELQHNKNFKNEILENPELGLLIFEAFDECNDSEIGSKRRRSTNKDVIENTSNTIV